MTPTKPTHTPPRQIRIGDTWEEFDLAAKAAGTTRAALINAFIDWYLHKPGATAVKRPPKPAEHAPPEA
jgi:hypothetical protein